MERSVMMVVPMFLPYAAVRQTAIMLLPEYPVQIANSATVKRPVTALEPASQELLHAMMASAVLTTPVMK